MSLLLRKMEFAPSKIAGASPSEDRFYVLIMFDIADQKKYRLLVKILKKYAIRVQKSVFEAQLKAGQIRDLTKSIEKIMGSERFYNESDNVRIYRIAGNCNAVVYGECVAPATEENIFI